MSLHTVDDTDLRLIYSGQWVTGGAEGEYNHTGHGTKKGSSVVFHFNGNSVSVYGTLNGEVPEVTYTLDGNEHLSTLALQSSENTMYGVSFYQSPILEEGNHTLTITAVKDEAPLRLDYIQFTSYSTQHSVRISQGIIAAIVIGCFVFLLLLSLMAWFIWRSRRQSKQPGTNLSLKEKGLDTLSSLSQPSEPGFQCPLGRLKNSTIEVIRIKKLAQQNRHAAKAKSHSLASGSASQLSLPWSHSQADQSTAIFTSIILEPLPSESGSSLGEHKPPS